MTPVEAAKRLKVTLPRIYHLLAQGDLPMASREPGKQRGKITIDPVALEAYVQRRAGKTVDQEQRQWERERAQRIRLEALKAKEDAETRFRRELLEELRGLRKAVERFLRRNG